MLKMNNNVYSKNSLILNLDLLLFSANLYEDKYTQYKIGRNFMQNFTNIKWSKRQM